ncbi:MAG: hypothetical protein AB9888_12930 [Bacteroidales bacterium]
MPQPSNHDLSKIQQEFEAYVAGLSPELISEEQRLQIEGFRLKIKNAQRFFEIYQDELENVDTDEFNTLLEKEIVIEAIEEILGSEDKKEGAEDHMMDHQMDETNSITTEKKVDLSIRISNFLLTADPSNPKAIEDISKLALSHIKPEEASTNKYILPLISMMKSGEFPVYGQKTGPGGFTGDDIVILLIVPIVSALLEELLESYGKRSVNALKEMFKGKDKSETRKKAEAMIQMQFGELDAIITLTHFSGDKRELEKIVSKISLALTEYLTAS